MLCNIIFADGSRMTQDGGLKPLNVLFYVSEKYKHIFSKHFSAIQTWLKGSEKEFVSQLFVLTDQQFVC